MQVIHYKIYFLSLPSLNGKFVKSYKTSNACKLTIEYTLILKENRYLKWVVLFLKKSDYI